MMQCPYCAEEVNDQAIKCKHCGEFFDKNKGRERKPKKRGEIECPYCHEIIKPAPRDASAGGCLIAIILLLCYVIPGIIYLIWQDGQKQCPKCKMALK